MLKYVQNAGQEARTANRLKYKLKKVKGVEGRKYTAQKSQQCPLHYLKLKNTFCHQKSREQERPNTKNNDKN